MNYAKIEKDSISNGLGVRVVLWISGCKVECEGCHNKELWDFNYGRDFDNSAKEELFTELSKSYIDGITLTGGHPLEIENVFSVNKLLLDIRKFFPQKTIWLYTGYTLNKKMFLEKKKTDIVSTVINLCDIVVDGPFVKELRDISLTFRGSKNQRIIDIKKSFKYGDIILWNKN